MRPCRAATSCVEGPKHVARSALSLRHISRRRTPVVRSPTRRARPRGGASCACRRRAGPLCLSRPEMPTVAGSNRTRSAHCPGAIVPRPGMRYLRAGSLVRRRTPSSSVKVPRLAHPVREEVQPEAGVAEVDQVRAGVGQRHHARRMPEQRRDAAVVCSGTAWRRAACRAAGRTRSRADPFRFASCVTGTPSCSICDQSPWNRMPLLRVLQVLAQALAERADRGRSRARSVGRSGLDRVEGIVRIEKVGLAQREIERQRLAAGVDVHLVAARDRLRAALVVLQRAVRDAPGCTW